MKKILYIILDGVGDRPIPELGNKTPLEAANTPNMDALAKKGKQGLMYTVGKNIAPESDVAVICLLGYDAHKYYTGRGPLESFAEELDIKDGDAAFRVNFATIDDKGTIIDRRVGRNLSTEEAASLSEEINKKVKLKDADFIFKNTIGHRGVLVIKSKKSKLSGMVTNTDPAWWFRNTFSDDSSHTSGIGEGRQCIPAFQCRRFAQPGGCSTEWGFSSTTGESIRLVGW